jgi:hypothetical protein
MVHCGCLDDEWSLLRHDTVHLIDAQRDRLLQLSRDVDLLREALPIFERVTRLAHTLASDVPITAEARKHIDRAYERLAALSSGISEQGN